MIQDNHKFKQTNVSAEMIIQGRKAEIEELIDLVKIYEIEGLVISKEQNNKEQSVLKCYINAEETLEADKVMEKIVKLFLPHIDILSEFQKKYDLKCSINLLINIIKNMPPGIVFDDCVVQFASKIDAVINIDMKVKPVVFLPN